MFSSVTMPTFTPAKPVVYTPPPPPDPSPTFTLARCDICRTLMRFGDEATHREWHLVNGLHGAGCALIASMAARRRTDAFLALDACSCGLETDDDKKEK